MSLSRIANIVECVAFPPEGGVFNAAPSKVEGACCGPANPPGGAIEPSYDGRQVARKVVKGGPFLCGPSYCRRYRPVARQSQMIDSAMSHIGFRCIRHM